MEKEKLTLSPGEREVCPSRPVSPSCGDGTADGRGKNLSFTEVRDIIFSGLGGTGGQYFRREDRAFARDLAAIITEVTLMPPDYSLRIGGELLPAGLVSEVFLELRCEHIETVISHYRDNAGTVRNKKAYLRTALYNAVFEQSAELEDSFKTAGGEVDAGALFGKIYGNGTGR